MNEDHPVDWTKLEINLDRAKKFMARRQPDGAMCSHLGPHGVYLGGGLSFSISPSEDGEVGWRTGNKGAVTVLVWQLRDQYKDNNSEMLFETGPFDQPTMDRIMAEVNKRFTVLHQWNGKNDKGTFFDTWSVLVKGGGGAAKPVMEYSKHCPIHYPEQSTCVFNGKCTWRKDAFAKFVQPSWVAAIDTFDTPSQTVSEDERLAELLDLVRPLLVKMDFHAQLVSASSAGEIEGSSPTRVFVPGNHQRRGIQLPAESFAELVRLAIIGYEMDS